MKTLLDSLMVNYPYFAAMILFIIGAFTVLTRSNLFKKLIGINIMESAIFLMFIAAGNIRGGAVPILDKANPKALYIKPTAISFNVNRYCSQCQCDRIRSGTYYCYINFTAQLMPVA